MNYKENEVIEISAEELAKRNTPEEVEEYIIEQADAAKLKSGAVIDWKQKLSSRKLWAAVLSVVLMCVSVVFGEEMTAEVAEVLKTAAYGLIAYIFGEGIVDAAREVGAGKVDAAKELSEVWFHSDTGDGDSGRK
jgi:hypothetical protein